MKVYLHEIKDIDHELDVNESTDWVKKVLESADEKFDEKPYEKKALADRKAKIHFNLRKVDDVVVASGDIDTEIRLLCSRCAIPFSFKIDEHFSSLYCKDKQMAGIAYLDNEDNPRGQNKGYARHAHNEGSGQKASEATDDLDITYLSEDFLDLSDVLAEQIQLRVPFQPLCKEDCKGICPNCGTNLNLGRCACSKIIKKNPFSILKDFKS